MDEKLKKELLEIYDSLSDEQKEKVKECKTMEEVSAFAAKEGIELPDEMLDEIAGGYVFYDVYTYKYRIINDKTGDLLDTVSGSGNEESAKKRARELGQSDKMISSDEWIKLEEKNRKKSC